METIKDVLQLRKKVRVLQEDASNLAVFAPSSPEADAYDLLAMELHDLDTALYNAVFIKNNSAISTLIEGITGISTDAEQVNAQLDQLTAAFQKARQVVQDANNFAGRSKETLDEVKGLLTLMTRDLSTPTP